MVCEVPNEIFCNDPTNTCVQMCCPIGTYLSEWKCVPYQRQQNGSWWLPEAAKDAQEKGNARVLYSTVPDPNCSPFQDQVTTHRILPNGGLSVG